MASRKLALFLLGGLVVGVSAWSFGYRAVGRMGTNRSAVNHIVTPEGHSIDVGGFPVNIEPSPDRRFAAVTNSGIEENLSIVDTATGQLTDSVNFDATAPNSKKKDGLYFGLRFVKTPDGKTLLYASHGSLDRVSVHELLAGGKLAKEVKNIDNRRPGLLGVGMPNFQAGLALSSDGSRLYAVNNQTFALSNFQGSLSVIDTASGKRQKLISLPGYPLDAVTLTKGPEQDKKVYVTSERDGVVCVVDTSSLSVVKEIRTGTNPTHLLLNGDQSRLYVSNAGSDSISVIDTSTDTVTQTVNVRPVAQRGLPGATPLGMSLSPDEKRLYVALADLDSVGVVDLGSGNLKGLVAVGWYPTAVYCTGPSLLVTVGKGQRPVNPNTVESYIKNNPGPNKDPRGNLEGSDSGSNIRFNERGLVTTLPVPNDKDLARASEMVVRNNRFREIDSIARTCSHLNPGIKHVIYMVKENRTYDQFFGDFKAGNGDPSLLLYGDDVIPNQRALARRFVLLDNFYANAEMSADGWSWATAGIASEFVQRNAQYDYSGRERNYDYEGQNNGSPVDAEGIRNVNDPPGGYLWDSCLKGHVEFKDYGFYMSAGVPIKKADGKPISEDNVPAMKAFEGRAALDFRMFDTDYADSQAWDLHHLTWPHQRKSWGDPPSTNRFTAWERDYRRLLKEDKVPPLMMVRFGNDHTNGTAPDSGTPSAMMADNDYAVGQLVEAVSKGPLWSTTAIIIVEDDAQGGFDHVDGHRSICLVVSPFVERNRTDSRFYNTDSAIRTVLSLLNLPPANQYLASAPPLQVFGSSPSNREPYTAILPPKKTFTVNTANSYRAADFGRVFHTDHEESEADSQLADILWYDKKGRHGPKPLHVHE